MNRAAGDSHPIFTPRQGQYLAFIHAYTLVNERPPAQADIQRFFRLTPPSVHQMLLTLERDGLALLWQIVCDGITFGIPELANR